MSFICSQIFRRCVWLWTHFHAIFTNVLSETKSIIVIFLPYFQCPVCLCLLEIIKVMHFEIILGCMYRQKLNRSKYIPNVCIFSLFSLNLPFYEHIKNVPRMFSFDVGAVRPTAILYYDVAVALRPVLCTQKLFKIKF